MINLIIIFVLSSMIFIINSTSVAIVKTNDEQLEDIFEKKKKSAALIKKVSSYYRRFQTLTNISIYFMSFLNAFLLFNLSQDNLFNASIYIFGYFFIYVLVLNHTARRIGLKYVERVATNFIGLYFIIFKLFYPITVTTYFMSRLIAKLFGLNENLTDKEMAEEQIRTLVNESTETGVLDEEESEMIQNVFEFDNTEVHEVMTHRTDIKGFDIKMSEKEIMEIFSKEPYTRYPVYKDNLDTILGTVHLKDFLPYMLGKRKKINLKSLMRKPYFIPESKKINDLMKEMQMTKNHIAIILDEYGGTSGLVTFENVIEELIGDVSDEFDNEEIEIYKIGKNLYHVLGSTNLYDVEEELEISLNDNESDTIAGFILNHIGHLPKDDEVVSFEYKNLLFKVLQIEDRTIEKVSIQKLEEEKKVE